MHSDFFFCVSEITGLLLVRIVPCCALFSLLTAGVQSHGLKVTDRSGQTGGLRYQYTEPIWPETGPNRSKSNLNLKFSVQTVRIGILVGLTGLPAVLTGLPVGLTGNRPNSNFFSFLV